MNFHVIISIFLKLQHFIIITFNPVFSLTQGFYTLFLTVLDWIKILCLIYLIIVDDHKGTHTHTYTHKDEFALALAHDNLVTNDRQL